MLNEEHITAPREGLRAHITAPQAWAFSLGTAIGWGSLVVTCSHYLAKAGPAGSVLGLLLGCAVMLLMSRNYHYLMNCFPDAGGAYAFCRESFGYDHGFLTAWFLLLTYLAVFWANATSLPLFARYFLGDVFRVGYLFTVFGYEIYLGEALLTIAAVLLFSLVCASGHRLAGRAMVVMGVLMTAGIAVCAVWSLAGARQAVPDPAFLPDSGTVGQILGIACISPWAFVGFENISHLNEEFTFPRRRVFRVLAAAVGTATALYILLLLLSTSVWPERYDSWLSYIRDVGNLEGLENLPAFYAVSRTMGNTGVGILMAVLLCLVFTSLIGNLTALSRLFYALGRDGLFSGRLASLNRRTVPGKAIGLVAAISCLIPLLGRTAVGWIVDVTTLGATLVYAFVSAAAVKNAALRGDRTVRVTGIAGLAVMFFFCLNFLIPYLITDEIISRESYFLFILWSLLGFFFFRRILARDTSGQLGKSLIVWAALLSLMMFFSHAWISQAAVDTAGEAIRNVRDYYVQAGVSPAGGEELVTEQLALVQRANTRSILVILCLFLLALGVLVFNFRRMRRRLQENEQELDHIRSIAATDSLTGVKSSTAYVSQLEEMNAEIRRGEAEPFAIVVCDLNDLKRVNDTLGHDAGDDYIREASRQICEAFRHSPVYRMGGDEFVVLLTGQDYENREELLASLDKRAEENLRTGGAVVSAGMSAYRPGRDTDARHIFERADTLMYQRKKELKADAPGAGGR